MRAGDLHVSHDGGNSWTTVLVPEPLASVSAGGSAALIALGASTDIYHFNVMLLQTTEYLTGNCGSACGSGDPSITANESLLEDGQQMCSNVGGSDGCAAIQGADEDLTLHPLSGTNNVNACDLMFQLNPNACSTVPTATVVFTVGGGQIFSSGGSHLPALAYMDILYKWTGVTPPPSACHTWPITKVEVCNYPVVPSCSNGTPNPVSPTVTDSASYLYWIPAPGDFYWGWAGDWQYLTGIFKGYTGYVPPIECSLVPEPLL
jgi:hypothetical protein